MIVKTQTSDVRVVFKQGSLNNVSFNIYLTSFRSLFLYLS